MYQAYPDQKGVWTIGIGFTTGVKPGDVTTDAEIDLRFAHELLGYEEALNAALKVETTQNEFDAMISLMWNIGIAAFLKSTVLRLHNQGNRIAAAKAFGLWDKITLNGKLTDSAGLAHRRTLEAADYLTPAETAVQLPMPVYVAPQKPMASSTTVIAGGTAALATTTQVIDQVTTLRTSTAALTDGFGPWVMPAIGVIALLAALYVIWARFQTRNNGQA